MYGYIYITENLINKMIYIGQHKATTFSKKYLGSGVNIRRAIKKYGKENFNVSLLCWCESQQEADEKERYWLNKYNLPNSSIGYNITSGGQKRFFTGCTHTEEARQKMSSKAKNRPHQPTTTGRCWYTDGVKSKTIKKEEILYYESIGWHKGRVITNEVWNKGLTKETDERVAKYTDKRNQHFKNGESIGCFGVKGNTFGFVKGQTPWNKGLKGYNKGHPNYYLGKKYK